MVARLLCEDRSIGTCRCGVCGGATAGSDRRLNLWCKTTSALMAGPLAQGNLTFHERRLKQLDFIFCLFK